MFNLCLLSTVVMLNLCEPTQSEVDSLMHSKNVDLLARVANSESSENYLDAAMVMRVCLNRSNQRRLPIRDVIYQKRQFSGVGNRMFNFNLNTIHGFKLRCIAAFMIKLNSIKDYKEISAFDKTVLESFKILSGNVNWISPGIYNRDINYFVNPKHCSGGFVRKVVNNAIYRMSNNHHYAYL
jgi:hypothetical protein